MGSLCSKEDKWVPPPPKARKTLVFKLYNLGGGDKQQHTVIIWEGDNCEELYKNCARETKIDVNFLMLYAYEGMTEIPRDDDELPDEYLAGGKIRFLQDTVKH